MGFLNKIFSNKKNKESFIIDNPNKKDFSARVLKSLQKNIANEIKETVKVGWIDKEDKLPLITISKYMDEVQKLYKTKIISFSFDIWANNKKMRNFLLGKVYHAVEIFDINQLKIDLSKPISLDFEENKGIYRSQFYLTIHANIKLEDKDIIKEKDLEKNKSLLGKLIFKESGIITDLIESKNKYFLVRGKEINEKDLIVLIKNNNLIWKKEFENIVSFDLAMDGSFIVVVTQLTKSEMPLGYKSGGHVYLINKEGKIKDIKIPCDGLSCSISPDCKNFGITTMGPEWGIYYYDNQGQILWKKKFDKRVGGIKLLKNKIILYNKMHEETRKEVMSLNNNGDEQNVKK
jgi:hypothetical protein